MNQHLSPPFQRTLAIAILVVIAAVIYYAVAQPLVDTYAADRATLAQRQDALLRYRRAAQELPLRQRELTALQQQQAAADGFLEGTSDTLIAAQIQNRVKTLANAARAELRSSQVLPAEAAGKLKRIAIRNQISAGTAGLLSIFHDLEAQSPSLFIDNVTLQVRPMALRDRDNPGNGDMIDIQFDVYGYAHGGG
ncbi:MAG TPA: type II secretion system protein GspM [Stellaceae bacterium]|jgi:general secretion pathway protein M|nr:type II secretion system protein GspM [Stellaceae bacterium]